MKPRATVSTQAGVFVKSDLDFLSDAAAVATELEKRFNMIKTALSYLTNINIHTETKDACADIAAHILATSHPAIRTTLLNQADAYIDKNNCSWVFSRFKWYKTHPDEFAGFCDKIAKLQKEDPASVIADEKSFTANMKLALGNDWIYSGGVTVNGFNAATLR